MIAEHVMIIGRQPRDIYRQLFRTGYDWSSFKIWHHHRLIIWYHQTKTSLFLVFFPGIYHLLSLKAFLTSCDVSWVEIRELENKLELGVMLKSPCKQGGLLENCQNDRYSRKKAANLLDRKCTCNRGLKMVKQIGKKWNSCVYHKTLLARFFILNYIFTTKREYFHPGVSCRRHLNNYCIF
jgi:hypothetical protein